MSVAELSPRVKFLSPSMQIDVEVLNLRSPFLHFDDELSWVRFFAAQGRTVDFKNTLIIMTSNVGSSVIEKGGGGLGFQLDTSEEDSSYNRIKTLVNEELKQYFRPEFLNRCVAPRGVHLHTHVHMLLHGRRCGRFWACAFAGVCLWEVP